MAEWENPMGNGSNAFDLSLRQLVFIGLIVAAASSALLLWAFRLV